MAAKIETGAVQIGAMLRVGGTYKVPAFQRDFSWDDEQYGRLWDDILTTIDERRENYFFGSMVINDNHPATLVVIDGQQRLTSISLLICALRDVVKKSGNAEFANRLTGDFLGRYDYQSKETVPRLELNKVNRGFYAQNILGGVDIAALQQKQRDATKSNKLLAAAYLHFRDKIEKRMQAGKAIDQIVAEIVEAMDTKLSVISIKVKDDYDAYLLFETLNDRGLALSVADLLKNYLFSRADDRLSEVQENWEHMSASLGRHEVKTFLRHFWLSKEGVVRDKELYREITAKYAAKNTITRFSVELKDSASFYGAFDDIDSDWWDTFDAAIKRKIRALIEQLNLFGVSQYYPLMLAVLEANESIFVDVLEFIVVFAFRYSVIGQLGTGNIEKAISDAARLVRANPKCTVKEAFAPIAPLYPNDDEFLAQFKLKEIRQAGLARYVLAKINDQLLGKGGLVTDRDPSEVNLEHILPKTFTNDWLLGFDNNKATAEEFVHRIGNMTLLTSKLNRALANEPFGAKKEKGYSVKTMEITKPILDKKQWTKAEIEERQNWLGAHAAKLWRLNF